MDVVWRRGGLRLVGLLSVVLHRLLGPRLLLAGGGELLLVFERPGELHAGAGQLGGGVPLRIFDAPGERG